MLDDQRKTEKQLKKWTKVKEQMIFKHKANVCWKIMALSIRYYKIMKAVQATHHKGDVKFGTSSGMQCSSIALTEITWTLVKSHEMWDKFDLDRMLGKGDQLFTFISKLRQLVME